MKQSILVFLLTITSLITHAQAKISLSDIPKRTGDSVELTAQLFGVKYLPDAKGSPTFVNPGAAYPTNRSPQLYGKMFVNKWQQCQQKD